MIKVVAIKAGRCFRTFFPLVGASGWGGEELEILQFMLGVGRPRRRRWTCIVVTVRGICQLIGGAWVISRCPRTISSSGCRTRSATTEQRDSL